MSGIGNGTAESIARWAADNPRLEVSWIDADGATRSIPEVLDEPKVLVYDRSA